jgi:hypothetical protein
VIAPRLRFSTAWPAAAFVVLSLAGPSSVHGQTGNVTGTVRDEASRQPVPAALVEVVGGWQRTLTDDSGRFVLRGVRRGEFTITVQALGYRSVEQQRDLAGERMDIEVLLPLDPVLMADIVVTVDRLRQRRNAVPYSVRVITDEQIRQHVSISAHDVLRQRLGVFGVPGQVYLDETLLVGGDPRRPAWLLILRGLPSEQIHSMEVYGNGRQVRVYTKAFMERAVRNPRLIMPVIIIR